LILYFTRIDAGKPLKLGYRLRALYPIRATVRPSSAYPYYEPAKRYHSVPGRIQVS